MIDYFSCLVKYIMGMVLWLVLNIIRDRGGWMIFIKVFILWVDIWNDLFDFWVFLLWFSSSLNREELVILVIKLLFGNNIKWWYFIVWFLNIVISIFGCLFWR